MLTRLTHDQLEWLRLLIELALLFRDQHRN
jgi:hypothetical protein